MIANPDSKVEILSPVGSFESLMAAIQGGTDAVYFGIGNLNMRSRSSQNFTIQDLSSICEICKNHNIKSYITLNTVIYDNEISDAKNIIDVAIQNGVDAIIASDVAVINYANERKIPVHASTQCNVSNYDAVKFYAKYCDVIVLARELNVYQIKHIASKIKEDNLCGFSGNLLRLEAFVHGALCMSVSGKCYLSLDNMNYSANRGACLQLCRRKYAVQDLEEGSEFVVDGAYIMSPKDLCTIDFLDKILDAGISLLKIEGRGRSPEYVKTATQCYKEAAAAIHANKFTLENIAIWKQKLNNVYNRGFWEGYYMGKTIGEWTDRYGSQAKTKKIYIGKVTNYFSKLKVAEIKIETQNLNINDYVYIIGPTTGVLETQISEIRVELKPVQTVVKGSFCSVPLKNIARRGDKLYKIVSNDDMFEKDEI